MTSPKRRRTVTKWAENTSAAAAIAGNDDLLVEILIRLPAKSVLRFRSVSKRWLSLISDPRFSLIWSKPKSVSGLLLRRLSHSGIPKLEYIPFDNRNQSSVPFTSLDFVDDDPEGIDVLQSCNGLLLCSGFRLRHHSCNYYVYNPTTNQFTALPRPVGFEKRIVRGVNLAFDSSKSHHYKVICVCSHGVLLLRGMYWIEIYSSETQNWRPYDDIVLGPSDMVFDKALFWNGSIHWLSRQSETSLCFDTDEECLKTIPMPPIEEGENERTSCYFGESGGHLHLAVLSGSHSALLNVFEMEPDYSKWLVKYRVDLDSIVASFPEMETNFPVSWDYCKFSVLCVLHGETENEPSLVIYIPGKVIYYNLKDNYIIKCFDVMNQTDNEGISLHCKWVIGHQYIESLINV